MLRIVMRYGVAMGLAYLLTPLALLAQVLPEETATPIRLFLPFVIMVTMAIGMTQSRESRTTPIKAAVMGCVTSLISLAFYVLGLFAPLLKEPYFGVFFAVTISLAIGGTLVSTSGLRPIAIAGFSLLAIVEATYYALPEPLFLLIGTDHVADLQFFIGVFTPISIALWSVSFWVLSIIVRIVNSREGARRPGWDR